MSQLSILYLHLVAFIAAIAIGTTACITMLNSYSLGFLMVHEVMQPLMGITWKHAFHNPISAPVVKQSFSLLDGTLA